MLKSLLITVVMVLGLASASDLIMVRQNSEPKYLPDGQGLCDQVYREMQSSLANDGVTASVDPQLYPIRRILKMLTAGEAHVFCGAGETERRRVQFGFSELPVYRISYVLLAREDVAVEPTSLTEIADENLTIGAFYGTSSAHWLKQQSGVSVSDQHHSLDNIMALINRGSGLQYFYYHDLALNHYLEQNDYPLKILPTRYRTINQWLLYSPTLSKAETQAIDRAFQTLHDSGRLTQINRQFIDED